MTINGIEVNGPRNAVLLYKQLVVIIAQEIDIVCKEGHRRGVCVPAREEIFYNWPESDPVCSPSDDGWVTVAPTPRPTTTRPPRTIPVFIKPETRPLVTIPPRTELETEATTAWEPVTSAVVTDATDQMPSTEEWMRNISLKLMIIKMTVISLNVNDRYFDQNDRYWQKLPLSVIKIIGY